MWLSVHFKSISEHVFGKILEIAKHLQNFLLQILYEKETRKGILTCHFLTTTFKLQSKEKKQELNIAIKRNILAVVCKYDGVIIYA